jgi:hypothetical protein
MPELPAANPELDTERELYWRAHSLAARAGAKRADHSILRGGSESSLEASPSQRLAHSVERGSRIVAVLAQMREDDVIESDVNALTRRFRCNAITQVAEVAAYPFLY